MLSTAALQDVPEPNVVPPTDRLIIQKIVAENFKSYAGRQEIGPFHKSFSSIVGPNGSGKSNVIDAIMFVLGYRARKMRQTKLADLIHVSEGMTEAESCTVEVYFQRIRDLENDKFELVPGSELVVSRTAWRNSRNVYTLNGVSSNYTEITNLLRDQGIDLDHKRFLILQGEVEAIAMMKPKGATEHEEGLLEYLEDIIGTNRYIAPIETAAQELDQINTIHADKLLRVRAAEKECGALAGEKEEAESYLRQENTKTEKKSEYLQATIWQSQKDVEKVKIRLEKKKEELSKERGKNQAASEKAEELESTIKAATNEAAELEKKVRKLQAELSVLEQNDVKMQETRKHLKNKLKSLSKQSSDTSKLEAELVRGLEDSVVTAKRLDTELENNRMEFEKATAELDKISSSLKGVTATHQNELDIKQNELAPLQDKFRAVQGDLEIAKSALALVTEKGMAGKNEQSKLKTHLDKARTDVAEAERKKIILDKQRKSIKQKIESLVENVKTLEEERNNRSKQLQLLQSTTAEAMASIQQNDSGSASYKALMKEFKSGRIKGIHGRLGDLGAIDSKYDVAIATACSYLDHIVVDTTEVGQRCIEFLRKNNVGRANFIVLDKMRPAMRESPRDLPNDARRLFDLVKLSDPRYIDAMYFALTDTLVATTLDEAQSWAYGKKRWRVITLDGKLFETSGTVSGGGQIRRGGMGSQLKGEEISQDQIKMLQDKCREVQDGLKQLATQIGKEQTVVADNEDQLIRTEAELSLMDGLVKSLSTEIEMMQKTLAGLEAKEGEKNSLSNEDEMERKKLSKDIGNFEKSIARIKAEMTPFEEAIARIQQQILDAGGIKYKVQRSKVDGLCEKIENGERRQTELAKEKVTLEKRLATLRSGQGDDVATSKVQTELQELDQRLQEATNKAILLHQELALLQNTLDTCNDQVETLEGSLDGISKSVLAFRKIEYEYRCAIEADETKMTDLEKTISSSNLELKQLCLHHIDPKQPAPVLSVFDEVDLEGFSKDLVQIKHSIDSIAQRLERSRPNLKVLEEYRAKEAILQEQQTEFSTIEENRDAIRKNFEDLRRQRLDEFMAGFRTISLRLKEMYQLITMGGNAELELVDSLDPFSEGVLFSVMPPRKSWKNISNLSGGEKTLSSLALVFALHVYRPTPIYIMDEIDAALDFRNVSIVAHYIKERTKNAQFIVVSLRNNMFELADRLVGIYKTWQRTKCVAINPQQFIVAEN